MARAIRLAIGSGEAASVALSYRRGICAAQAEPGPTPPRTLHGYAQGFNGVIAVGTCTTAHYLGSTRIFLGIIDVASRFGIAAQVPPRHP